MKSSNLSGPPVGAFWTCFRITATDTRTSRATNTGSRVKCATTEVSVLRVSAVPMGVEEDLTMRSLRIRKPLTLIAMGCLLTWVGVDADEGMWTFDAPPLAQLKSRYNFVPPSGWLDHVRLSSVRFNDGGSGSFISANGLVLTNHHVALDQLQKMSTAQKNYVRDGFYAARRDQEIRSTDLELNILESYENVTNRIAGKSLEIRKQTIAAIEKENLDKTGLRSDVV